MPAFRDTFRHLNEDEYKNIEDVMEAYLLLTIRFVLDDVASGRVSLTPSREATRMNSRSVEPAQKPISPKP